MKYQYKFCVYYNNMCNVGFVAAFDTLKAAWLEKRRIENSGGGCCDVVKKRFTPGATLPDKYGIYNNKKYYMYHLWR